MAPVRLRREMLKYAFPTAPDLHERELRTASDEELPAPQELAEATTRELTEIYRGLHEVAVR